MEKFFYTKKLSAIIETIFLIVFAYGIFVDNSIMKELPDPILVEHVYLKFFVFVGGVVALLRTVAILASKYVDKNPASLRSLVSQWHYLLNLGRAGANLFFLIIVLLSATAFMSRENSLSANLHEVLVMLFFSTALLYPIYKGLDVLEKPTAKNILLLFLPLLLLGAGYLLL